MNTRVPGQPSPFVAGAVAPLAALRVLNGLVEDCGLTSIRGAYIFNRDAR